MSVENELPINAHKIAVTKQWRESVVFVDKNGAESETILNRKSTYTHVRPAAALRKDAPYENPLVPIKNPKP